MTQLNEPFGASVAGTVHPAVLKTLSDRLIEDSVTLPVLVTVKRYFTSLRSGTLGALASVLASSPGLPAVGADLLDDADARARDEGDPHRRGVGGGQRVGGVARERVAAHRARCW